VEQETVIGLHLARFLRCVGFFWVGICLGVSTLEQLATLHKLVTRQTLCVCAYNPDSEAQNPDPEPDRYQNWTVWSLVHSPAFRKVSLKFICKLLRIPLIVTLHGTPYFLTVENLDCDPDSTKDSKSPPKSNQPRTKFHPTLLTAY